MYKVHRVLLSFFFLSTSLIAQEKRTFYYDDGIIESKGYQPLLTIPTDGVRRAIYEDIGNEDAEDLICNTGGIRTVYLKHKSTKS